MHTVLVDAYAAQAATGIKAATLRKWLSRGCLSHHGYDRSGRVLVNLAEIQARQERKASSHDRRPDRFPVRTTLNEDAADAQRAAKEFGPR